MILSRLEKGESYGFSYIILLNSLAFQKKILFRLLIALIVVGTNHRETSTVKN